MLEYQETSISTFIKGLNDIQSRPTTEQIKTYLEQSNVGNILLAPQPIDYHKWAASTLMLGASVAITPFVATDLASTLLYCSAAITCGGHILRAYQQSESVADTLGNQIACITSLLTAIMPLATNKPSYWIGTLMVFSYIANQVLYSVDVPQMLRNIKAWFTLSRSAKCWSFAYSVLSLVPATIAAYLITADMYVGASNILPKPDDDSHSLLQAIVTDSKWVVSAMLPTFIACFSFTKKGLDLAMTLAFSAVYHATVGRRESVAAQRDEVHDLENKLTDPLTMQISCGSTQQSSEDAGNLQATTSETTNPAMKAIVFISASALAYYSQSGLVNGIIKNIAIMPTPLIQSLIAKNLGKATIIAIVARILLCTPKIIKVANTAAIAIASACKQTPQNTDPPDTELTIATMRINQTVFAQINSALKKKCNISADGEGATQDKATYQTTMSHFLSMLRADIKRDKSTLARGASWHQSAHLYKINLFCRTWLLPICIAGNGGANIYLCDTWIRGILNGLVSIGINGTALLEVEKSLASRILAAAVIEPNDSMANPNSPDGIRCSRPSDEPKALQL